MTTKYFTNSFSEETWYQKYKFHTDNSVVDTWHRVAKYLASVEVEKKEWAEKFFNILEGFKFIPGGRITSNAGTKLTGTTMINCFVSGHTENDSDIDSIEGIYAELQRQAQILKSEGGYGFHAGFLRPNGAHIGGIANQSPGVVKFLELWDKSSEIITAGSNKQSRKDEKNFIRKGAQMVTLRCDHPDIISFIKAKQTQGCLTKFNMSVLCTDDFMTAVAMDMPWDLVFPNYEAYPALYKKHWTGDLEAWKSLFAEIDTSENPSILSYFTFESARDLWKIIMESTYNRNEPGVVFIDTVNKMNNLSYCEHIMASNPCGEQFLPNGGSCLLGSINLVHFIDTVTGTWKLDELQKIITTAVRMLDNVNDLTYVPLKEQKRQLKNKRRIGLGITGFGSALMMARVRYGSKKSIKLTEELMACFTNTAYKASAMLAKEKGSFPAYDQSHYLQGRFVQQLSKEVRKDIASYGLRNSHLTSIQPTGNSSCFANLVSGGLEPVFSHGYFRTSIQPDTPDGLILPEKIDWKNKKHKELRVDGQNSIEWKWVKEGDDDLLATTFNNKVWKIDKQRGLLKEEWVEDYGVSYLKEAGLWNADKDWADTTTKLTVDDHLVLMQVFAKWIDSAISKTINIPNSYSYDDFKHIYKKAWETGIKGITTYRAGTMSSVLSNTSSLSNLPKRPKELPCDVHHIQVKGEQYFVLVGIHNDIPYEIFAGKNGFIDRKTKKGIIIKLGRPKGVYKAILEDNLELSPVNIACTAEEDALTRMSSTALRHGADVHMIVQQLEKVKGDMHCFAKSMARALKKYIPNGTKENCKCPECNKSNTLIRQEGCLLCSSCGYSACS